MNEAGRNRHLPGYLKRYFWDVRFAQLSVVKDKFFIIKRLLEYSDKESVKWLFQMFKIKDIKYALVNFRGYSPKTINFWSIILGIKNNTGKSYDWQ